MGQSTVPSSCFQKAAKKKRSQKRSHVTDLSCSLTVISFLSFCPCQSHSLSSVSLFSSPHVCPSVHCARLAYQLVESCFPPVPGQAHTHSDLQMYIHTPTYTRTSWLVARKRVSCQSQESGKREKKQKASKAAPQIIHNTPASSRPGKIIMTRKGVWVWECG